MRTYDSQSTARIANFVKGRTDIPREMFTAAFPKAGPTVMALLSALGHLEKAGRKREVGLRNLEKARAARAAKAPEREAARIAKQEAERAAKVAKLEARLAKLRA